MRRGITRDVMYRDTSLDRLKSGYRDQKYGDAETGLSLRFGSSPVAGVGRPVAGRARPRFRADAGRGDGIQKVAHA